MFSQKMEFKNFENLIGKDLKDVNITLNADFKNYMDNKNIYFMHYENVNTYYDLSYNTISIMINNQNKIESVTIHFTNLVNRKFLNSFTLDYDNQTTTQVFGDKVLVDEGYSDDGNQYLKQHKGELREGTFEENPLFLLWRKKEFKIMVFMRYELGVSEITFSEPNDKF